MSCRLFAKLFQSRTLLPNLLCMLLIFNLPVMAQGACEFEHIETLRISADCVMINPAYEGPPICGETPVAPFEFDNGHQQTCPGIFNQYYDPNLILKRFNQGATLPSDQRNTYDMGIDPATLRPEALNLDIFPSFQISAQLSLRPSLSYSPDHVMARMGRLQYGPPKQWRNHYGELVVMVGAAASQKTPLGKSLDSPATESNRKVVPSEMQVFFINANGQQVNFYPDPSRMSAGNKPSATSGQVGTWFSEEGGYRLEDTDADAQNPSDAFQFELKTPQGLTFEFEPYTYRIDSQKEALSRHYRVTRILDRYDNFIEILYRDEVEPSYPAGNGKTLQPYTVAGHANGPFGVSQTTKLQELGYRYDSRNRLKEIILPGFGVGQTQSYKFYYLDSEAVKDFDLPDHTTTNRLKLNNVYDMTLSSIIDQGVPKVVLPPLDTVMGYYQSPNLYLDYEDLGFAPETGIDFQEIYSDGHPNFPGQFVSAPYRFHLDDLQNTHLLAASGLSRQVFSELKFGVDAVRYRYQLDPMDYPSGVSADYPDMVNVATGETVLVANGEVSVGVLPRLKEDDLFVWIDGIGKIQSAQLEYLGVSPDNVGNTYRYPLTNSSATLGGTENLYFIRKDQRDRIAEIEFPGVSGSTSQRMLFKYAEHSRNHAEIEEILVFDVPVPDGSGTLLSQTTYSYEQVLVQTAAEDLAPMLPVPLSEYNWRNCVREGRELADTANADGVSIGIGLLRRHEVIDILRYKRSRYYEPGLEADSLNNCIYENYRDLETYFGGAWQFALMTRSTGNEEDPLLPDQFNTCDEIEWGVAQKPFLFTWQINPDGSAQVFDLSPDGLGLDPVLAYANKGTRVFKTYQFDTNFKAMFAASTSDYRHFLGSGGKKFSPYYKYLPNYVVNTACSGCTIPDLESFPTFPLDFQIPTLEALFLQADSKAYSAEIQYFEPLPLYGYDLLTTAIKKVALGTLHGSIQGTGSDRNYYRISAVFGIGEGLDHGTNCDESLIDRFFRGQFTSDVSTKMLNAPNFKYEVPWVYGGDLSTGSCFEYLYHRQKNHRLRSHAQIHLNKLDGLEWNASDNLIDLELDANEKSPWVVEATRFSNGGYLGEGDVDTVTNPNTLDGTSTWPSDVHEKDYFYYNKKIYQLLSESGGSWSIAPALEGSPSSLEGLKFYRFFDPEPLPNYPYLGYDHFGNNAFKATYKKSQLFFTHPQNKANGLDHGLVPGFFEPNAKPFKISLNDSTAETNNDHDDWAFFGRVTRMFDSGSLPLNAENASGVIENHTTWKTGLVTDWAYPTSSVVYEWMPSDKVAYFLPVTTSFEVKDLNVSRLQSGTFKPTGNAKDFRTTYRYYRPENSSYSHSFDSTNPMSHGRVSLEWSGRGLNYPSESQMTATRFEYDNFGWLSTRDTATFVLGAGVYGMRTTFENDPAMGLVTEEKTLVFDDIQWVGNGTSPSLRLVFNGTGVQRGRTENSYDLLGRNIGTKSFDASNGVFGFVKNLAYPSQTQTIIDTKNTTETTAFRTEMTFMNGHGQTRTKLYRRGETSENAYAVYSDYDAFGRLQYTSAELELSDFTVLEDLAVGETQKSGFTKTIYNLRGEAFGSVVFDGQVALQSAWELHTQDANGELTTLRVHQVPEAAVGSHSPVRVNIKALIQNDDGLLETVEDFQIPLANSLWTKKTEADLLQSLGTLADPLSKAIYSYDRMMEVTQAEVGNGSTIQIRTMIYDQRGRLRRESHPEMPGVTIYYDDFSHFDNPQSVTHKMGSTVKRQWTSTYDSAGNMLSFTAGNPATESTEYVYNYQGAFDPGYEPAAFPELPRFVRHIDADGDVAAYWHRYHLETGLLAERRFYHDHAGFPGESSNVQTLDLTTHVAPSWVGDDAATSYTYDSYGRVVTQIYPAAPNGMADPTKLVFTFGSLDGQLKSIVDEEVADGLTLMENLDYGVGNQVVNVDFAAPGVGSNRLTRDFDAIVRQNEWQVTWNGGIGEEVKKRTYLFDSASRIRQIDFENGTDGYLYAYDGLGQIAQAKFTSSNGQTNTTWDFVYDNDGFGNLTSLKQNNSETLDFGTSQATNRLTGTGVTYSDLGELEQFVQNSTSYGMGYNDLGRMTSIQVTGGLDSEYDYDHDGMRVFTHVDGVGAAGLKDKRTLYFYDAEGKVLSEWVSLQNPDTAWATPRWDRTYIYLVGKSSITYEFDAVETSPGGSSVPNGPSITTAEFISEPTFEWEDAGPGAYDFQVREGPGKNLVNLSQIKGPQVTLPNLKFGKFEVRARRSGGAWGDWETVYFMDSQSQEKVGDYPLDWEVKDKSYFQHNLMLQGSIHFMDGKHEQGLFINEGEALEISAPHTFLQGDYGSVSFWANPTVDKGGSAGSDRELWSLGDIRLTVNSHGRLKLTWTGASGFLPNASLDGDNWQHIVLIYGDATIKLYVDTQLTFNLTGVPTGSITTSDMKWGNSNTSLGCETGIDEIHCFDKSLSSTEINEEFTKWD